MKFPPPVLVKEDEEYFKGKTFTYPLRVYRTDEDGVTRWHLGFKREMIGPPTVISLLETTCYWGETHWHEDGDFLLWWAPVLTSGDDGCPDAALDKHARWLLGMLKACHAMCRKWAE